jgi:hypothetical protein
MLMNESKKWCTRWSAVFWFSSVASIFAPRFNKSSTEKNTITTWT